MLSNLYDIFTTTFYQAAPAKVAELEKKVGKGNASEGIRIAIDYAWTHIK